MGLDAVPSVVAPPAGVALRPDRADAADDEAWRRLNREAYEGSSDYFDLTPADCGALREEPGFHLWFAEAQGQVVGLCHTKTFGGLGCVNSLVVAESLRGRGLGRALLLAGITSARERTSGRCRLSVRAENASAVALYHSVGFETDDDMLTLRRDYQ